MNEANYRRGQESVLADLRRTLPASGMNWLEEKIFDKAHPPDRRFERAQQQDAISMWNSDKERNP